MLASYALIARNLALTARRMPDSGQHELVAPCSACYLNLSKCDKYMRSDADLAEKVNQALAAGGLQLHARLRQGAPSAGCHRERCRLP